MGKSWQLVGIRAAVAAFVLSALALPVVMPACAAEPPKDSAPTPSSPIGKAAHQIAAALLDQLKTAKDVATAQELEAKIWAAWMNSGSGEIDHLVQQSLALMQFQQLDDALAVLDVVVAKAPDYAEGWNKRATLLYAMGQFDRSLADIGKVLALEPRHFGAISGIGLIRLAKGDRAGAVAAYLKVLEIDPKNAGARQSIEALGKTLLGNPI